MQGFAQTNSAFYRESVRPDSGVGEAKPGDEPASITGIFVRMNIPWPAAVASRVCKGKQAPLAQSIKLL